LFRNDVSGPISASRVMKLWDQCENIQLYNYWY